MKTGIFLGNRAYFRENRAYALKKQGQIPFFTVILPGCTVHICLIGDTIALLLLMLLLPLLPAKYSR